MENVNLNIELYRKQKGLTQDELAEKIGTSRQTISGWERGVLNPTLSNLIELKKVFGVSIDKLVGCDDIKSNDEKETKISENFNLASLRNMNSYIFGRKNGMIVGPKTNSKVGNTLVIGNCGTGKTRNIVIPNVRQSVKQGLPIIVTDLKGEVYNELFDELTSKNYTINKIDFETQHESWNVIKDIFNDSKNINEYCNYLYGHLYFNISDTTALETLILNVALKNLFSTNVEKDICSLYKCVCVISNHIKNDDTSDGSLSVFENMDKELLVKASTRLIVNMKLMMEEIFIENENNISVSSLLNPKTITFLDFKSYNEKTKKIFGLFMDMMIFKILHEEKMVSIFLDEYNLLNKEGLCDITNVYNLLNFSNCQTTVLCQNIGIIDNKKINRLRSCFSNIILMGKTTFTRIDLLQNIFNINCNEKFVIKENELLLIRKDCGIEVIEKI